MTSSTAPTRRRAAARWTLAVTAAVGLAAAACSSTGSNSASDTGGTTTVLRAKGNDLEAESTPQTGGRLVVGVGGETNGWNPFIDQWADAGSMIGSTFLEPLVVMNKDGSPENWLAESLTPNADYTQWDITVKDGISFSNGEKLDGEAVKMSLDLAYQGGLTATALAPIYDHVEVTGPRSVKVFLKVPWAVYPQGLNQAGWMMAPEMLKREDHGVVNPIGTGPFVFSDWTRDSSLKVTRNPNYWRKDSQGRSMPYLDEIEFKVIVDDDQKINALDAGDVDLILTDSAEQTNRAHEKDYTIIQDYQSERTFLLLNGAEAENNKGNPFTNVHARRALAYATDPEQLRQLKGEGMQTSFAPWGGTDPRWEPTTERGGYPAHDLDKARAEIEAYKKDTGQSELTFKLSGLTKQEDLTIMQALQAQWAEAGIKGEIVGVEQAKFIIFVVTGQYQAAWMRLFGYPDPDADRTFFVSDTLKPQGQLSLNFSHYTSPSLDEAFYTGMRNEDFATRKAAYDKALAEINDQALNIWLYNTPYALIMSNKVHGMNGFRIRPFGNYIPKPWWGEVWLGN